MRSHEGPPPRLSDLLLYSGREDTCDRPVDLSRLVSKAMLGACVASITQTMAAACQMVASVSDSEMPTAIKNLLSENKSFYSGPIW